MKKSNTRFFLFIAALLVIIIFVVYYYYNLHQYENLAQAPACDSKSKTIDVLVSRRCTDADKINGKYPTTCYERNKSGKRMKTPTCISIDVFKNIINYGFHQSRNQDTTENFGMFVVDDNWKIFDLEKIAKRLNISISDKTTLIKVIKNRINDKQKQQQFVKYLTSDEGPLNFQNFGDLLGLHMTDGNLNLNKDELNRKMTEILRNSE